MHFEVGMVLTVLSFHVMPMIFQSFPWWAALLFPFRKAHPPLFLFGVRSRIICEKKESVTFREAEAGNGLCVPKNWTKSIHSERLSDRDCHEDQCCVLTLLGFTITRTGGVNSVNSVNLVRDKGSRVAAANGSMDAALASLPTASSSSSTSTDSTIKSCILYYQRWSNLKSLCNLYLIIWT